MSEKTVETLLEEMGQKEVYSTLANNTVRNLAHNLSRLDVGALVVLDGDDNLIGIVSERDIVRKIIHQGRSDETLVKDIMSTDVVYVTPFTNLEECERLMKEKSIRHLPVVHNGEVIAVISIRDLLVSTRLEQEQLVRHLKGYIMPGHSV